MTEQKLLNFGSFIKSIREKRGLTISQLAENVGYSNPYLSQIEAGKRKKPPTPEFLEHLSDGLNVSYSILLDKAGYSRLAKGQLYYEEMINFFKDSLKRNFSSSESYPRGLYQYLEELNNRFDIDFQDYLKHGLEKDELYKLTFYDDTINEDTLNKLVLVFEDLIPLIYQDFLAGSKLLSHFKTGNYKQRYQEEEIVSIPKSEDIFFTELIHEEGHNLYVPVTNKNLYDLSRVLMQKERTVLYKDNRLKDYEKNFLYKFMKIYLNTHTDHQKSPE